MPQDKRIHLLQNGNSKRWVAALPMTGYWAASPRPGS